MEVWRRFLHGYRMLILVLFTISATSLLTTKLFGFPENPQNPDKFFTEGIIATIILGVVLVYSWKNPKSKTKGAR